MKKILLILLIFFYFCSAAYPQAEVVLDMAEDIGIEDAGEYYTSEDVEGALQEIGAGGISESDTLDTVCDRGSTTDQAIEVNGLTSNNDINLVSAKKFYIDNDKDSYHYYDSVNNWVRFYLNGVEIMRFE